MLQYILSRVYSPLQACVTRDFGLGATRDHHRVCVSHGGRTSPNITRHTGLGEESKHESIYCNMTVIPWNKRRNRPYKI